jgi:hypothetical protein
MSTSPTQDPEFLRRVLLHPKDGIVSLVDDLLILCKEQALELDWQSGRCRLRSTRSDSQETVEVPLRRSIFRAILARVAALCNERNPNSVSPYGGQGELDGSWLIFSAEGEPRRAVIKTAFKNTPDEQRLSLAVETELNNGPAQHDGKCERAVPTGKES